MPARRLIRSRPALALAALATAVTTLAACSGSSSSPSSNNSGGKPLNGGTATINNIGGGPNYIFPLASAEFFSSTNISELQNLLWRPLYWFGVGSGPSINYDLSLAKAPVYSNGNKTVTITLNDYNWSDGQPVTSRDVEFWQNLVTAEKANWADYTPGDYPDNIAKTTVVDDHTIRFDLTKAYDTNWFTYNELSQITPLPQHVWDKTSATGKVGDYDQTAAGAKKVYDFLAGAAKDKSSYASNPLWQTVDGPWKLTDYTGATGDLTMKPNTAYSGTKPHLAEFKEKNYTTTDAEFNALVAGHGPDVGFISPVELKSQGALDRLGYSQVKAYTFSISYDFINFNNPDVGPMFKQLYIRQVLQMLRDQEGISQQLYSNTGIPTCGPIPGVPPNSFADAIETTDCPYSFDVAKAIQLLKDHGWTVNPGGIDTCADPGTADNQCGAGIKKGAQLKFQFIWPNIGIAYPKAIAQEKSDASKAGVDLELKSVSINDLYADTTQCKPTDASCDWQISAAGGWIYAPDYYPTGEALFQTGAGYNLGSYSDPKADQLIKASTLPGNSQATLNAYQDYIAQQLPVLWYVGGYSLDEVKSNLHGVTPLNIFGNITPETWYWTGSIPKENS